MSSQYVADKASTSSADVPVALGKNTGYALDEKRRAALQEIDTAKFS